MQLPFDVKWYKVGAIKIVSEGSLRQIADIFCGDTAGFYSYKTGPQLVSFFNQQFRYNDKYGQGFPSRWAYVYDKLVDMLNGNRIDTFLGLILSKEYLMRDCGISQVEAAERGDEIYREFNRILQQDLYKITRNRDEYHLVEENTDLAFIGEGGFANVYRQKSTGLIVKKLKDDFLTDRGIRSRFKREFNITKSLQDAHGIIQVYTFDEGNCSYTMEPAEITLEKYVRGNSLTDEIRINCIRQILYIMSEVHKRDIIHRDISANNIFIVAGMLKIADFGLGKDLNVFNSHNTFLTRGLGQYIYCAPEQFMMLKEGDKQSDVYSLGRVINFIMTGDPRDSHHIFRSVAEKATNDSPAYRYADAVQLSAFFEKALSYHQQGENQERIEFKIRNHEFDEEVESHLYDLTAEKISTAILSRKDGFAEALFSFMHIDDSHAQHIIQSIDKTYQSICGTFADYDPFARFAYNILQDNFPYVVKEIAANILRYVATDVNRFSAQRLIDSLKRSGLEPMLEDILDS